MKKWCLAVGIVMALGLSGCGSKVAEESGADVEVVSEPIEADEQEAEQVQESKAFELTEEGKSFLADMCRTLPDFEGQGSMDEEFWRNFLFGAYTGASPEEAEMVQVPREDLGFEETAVKVSVEEAEAYTKLVLGVDLPDFKPAFEDMPEGQTSCFYRDGYYYIGVSDFPDYRFEFSDFSDNGGIPDTYSVVMYSVSFEDEIDAGTVTFQLYPADNENGFVIASKKMEL